MADSCEGIERVEEGTPLFAEGAELASSGLSEPVVAAIAPGSVGFPVSLHPSALFHFVQQRVQGGKRELQRTPGPLPDLLSDLESVQRFFCEQ